MTDANDSTALDRRRVLGGAAALGLAGPILAACGSGGDSSSSGSSSASGDLVKAADVPVGGGVVIDAKKVVVTQPTKGDFRAFTAVCTHQGCLVSTVEDDTIKCPCHGSEYSAEDGSVKAGPAPAPLAKVDIKVKGAEIVTA